MSWASLLRLGVRDIRPTRYFSTSRTFLHSARDVMQDSKSVVQPATKAVKDVVIFRFEDPKFFKYLNLFAVSQFGFWIMLCLSSLSMVDTPVPDKKETSKKDNEKNNSTEEWRPFWRAINLGNDKYKYGLCVGSFLMGYGILFISWMYIIRSVRLLVLRKTGKTVAFVTYGPFGKNRIMDVPVNCISAAGSRFGDSSQMPVKVKGRALFYILDIKKGEFPQPKLFDQTVGLSRKI